ncbi:beta-ketoacyl-ACP synthase II [Streptococcus sp. sy010]|uniref:beta-ketoacyl-ACP synthase II n=1 Tax=Streptococcus sp. sy010 TaxID=2600148 RepID=UPI0011B3E55B|nr:beta-ketoacyl-ACP synthase II [Streptococcus sp. sy010]TWT16483.1 beta-ketoacyl-ACP synthase II [Streptococcus sp. sy010]
MTVNRVVVTGYGVTSPIGNTPEEFWKSLETGQIGIGPITRFDTSELPVHNAGEIKDFPFDKYFVRKDKNRMDMYSIYAIYATLEALENAGLDMASINSERTGVIVSSGIGGLQEMQEQIIRLHEKGMKRIQPMFVPKALSNMAAGNIALRIGAQGVCKSITTACASANDAIGEAFREIKFGLQDVVLAGGAEATINEIGIGGFNALTALSTTEDPTRSSIPFDKDRNGFVMGEGAGVLVLESLEHAQKRGATILAEVVGYGNTCDAYHQTSPSPDGSGAARAMRLAIEEAGITASDVDYVNAHGTSTPANEKGESQAIVAVVGRQVPVSSTKSFTGHLLGAAGGVEAIATIEAMRHGFIPMTAGTQELSEDIEANVVYDQGQEAEIKYALSNTFGFGGHNAVTAFKRWED